MDQHPNPAPASPDIRTDIAIVGGGLNGTALALALARYGHAVTLIDALPVETRADPGFDGRGYALSIASVRLLQALGVWPLVADQAQPILKIRACDGRAGQGASPLYLEFDHAEIEEGPMGHMVEDRVLRPALLTAIGGAGVRHLAGETVVAQAVDDLGAVLELASGATIRARLIIGADGRASPTARRAGITRNGRDYGQTALVCAVEHDLPHEGTAWQLFLPHGPLAILPLTGNRSSIVWSETTAEAARIAALDDAGYLEELRPRFGDFLGEIRLAGARFSYPLILTLANSFIAKRLALVGDAAHGVHPIAGQGLNLGLRDVAALTEVLTHARRRGDDIGSAITLAGYQRWRRFDTTTLALGMDAVNRLFSNDNPVLRLGRDLGLGAVGALPGLRRRFIREAAGLTGDLPRLMAGQPI
ncbi:MAG: UbiH/UbiF/VisC/COQ6 family ubiquinone biosynthesis hydroxylase [Rhodobacteraceae bacterium]|nr:UbiH/UbiF/VisC/COQ6 family ubiquinone biosynthesis hydroxylase [Paracoccaceae bacterium]